MTQDYYTFFVNHILRTCKNNGIIDDNYFIVKAWLKYDIERKTAEEENALCGYFKFDPSNYVFYWHSNDNRLKHPDDKKVSIFIATIKSVSLKDGSPLRKNVWQETMTLTVKCEYETHTFYLLKA